MAPRRIVLVVLLAACTRARGQSVSDPEAPVRCFHVADDEVSTQDAIDLCVGAQSEAPAQCLVRVGNRLSDSQALALCRLATSTAPVDCLARLDDTTSLADSQIIEYCGRYCVEVPPATYGGDPACIELALDRTGLAEGQAITLCAGATSAAPAECFLAGDAQDGLADSQLVQLCARPPVCAANY